MQLIKTVCNVMRLFQTLNPLEINQLELDNCACLREGETSGQDNQELKTSFSSSPMEGLKVPLH